MTSVESKVVSSLISVAGADALTFWTPMRLASEGVGVLDESLLFLSTAFLFFLPRPRMSLASCSFLRRSLSVEIRSTSMLEATQGGWHTGLYDLIEAHRWLLLRHYGCLHNVGKGQG